MAEIFETSHVYRITEQIICNFLGSCLPKTPTREDLATPLPSFLEVQWSSFKVCDPILTYKQSSSPPPPTTKSGEDSPTTKNLSLLSPGTPGSFDSPPLHPDLLLDNTTYETSNIDNVVSHGEINGELWQV